MLSHDEKPERGELSEEDLQRILEMTNSTYGNVALRQSTEKPLYSRSKREA
jgi:hypothetical protein